MLGYVGIFYVLIQKTYTKNLVLIGLLACPIILDVASFALAGQFGYAELGGVAAGIWQRVDAVIKN